MTVEGMQVTRYMGDEAILNAIVFPLIILFLIIVTLESLEALASWASAAFWLFALAMVAAIRAFKFITDNGAVSMGSAVDSTDGKTASASVVAASSSAAIEGDATLASV